MRDVGREGEGGGEGSWRGAVECHLPCCVGVDGRCVKRARVLL